MSISTSTSSSPQPHIPKSLIYRHPLLLPPKTKWDLLPSSYKFTPAEYSRASDEGYHLREASFLFGHHFVLTQQTLSNLRHQQQSNPISKEDSHLFCWKDCAIYITVDLQDEYGSTAVGVERVFNFLYRVWMRDDEAVLDFGHFFGHPVECWHNEDGGSHGSGGGGGGGVKTIKEIVSAHWVICQRVKEKQADQSAGEGEEFVGVRKHGNFVVKRSFERFLVVVDRGDWFDTGVLLVRSEKLRKREEEEEGVKGEWPVFEEGEEGWTVRMGMKEVVDLVRGMEKEQEDGKRLG